jgi:oligosaccharyltransferase complex subunit beta
MHQKILLCTLLGFTLIAQQIFAADPNASPVLTRTLVLSDNEAIYATHTAFINDLRLNGHALTMKILSADAIITGKLSLMEDKQYIYDNLIIMTTSLEDLTTSTVFDLHHFFDQGGNISIIGDFDTSDRFKDWANDFGFNFDKAGSYVIDYQKAYSKGTPNLFWTPNYKEFPMLADGVKGDLLYNGIGLTFTHYETDQITVFLRGNTHTASLYYDEITGKHFNNLGKNVVLVAGIQGINNARILVAGSLDMFSDELFSKSRGANRAYVQNLIEWMSHRRGFLRLKNNKGTCVDSKMQESECPVKSKFIYDIEIDEWNYLQNQWVPYNADDVYFQLKFMDTKINKRMERVSDGKYHVYGQVPDRMGSYTFHIRYSRPGYSLLTADDKIFVRPFNYKENVKNWERDSTAAIGVGVVLGGFVVVSVLFLYDTSRGGTI